MDGVDDVCDDVGSVQVSKLRMDDDLLILLLIIRDYFKMNKVTSGHI